MKISDGIRLWLSGSFTPQKCTNLYSDKLTISLGDSTTNTEDFLLSEVFLSELLKGKISVYFDDDMFQAQSRLDQTLSDSTTNSNTQQQYELAELYMKALNEVPYKFSEDRTAFLAKVDDYLLKNYPEFMEEIEKGTMPKNLLILDYNPELVKLIFQMRHHLFFDTEVKLTPETVMELFIYYDYFIFDENTVTDIFLEYEEYTNAHLKIKCDVVFGINLYHLLEQQQLLEEFKCAIFGWPCAASRFINDKTVPDEDKFDFIGEYKFIERLSFISSLFRILSIGYPTPSAYSLNFVEAFDSMRFVRMKDDEIFLLTQTDNPNYSPIDFLNLFNDSNQILRNICRIEANVPMYRAKDYDGILCALVSFSPRCKQLYLKNREETEYNQTCRENKDMIHFDKLIYDILLNNKAVLNTLSRFVMHGFSCLTDDTVSLLRQYKFDEFGMKGIFSTADELYFYLLFKDQDLNSLENKDVATGEIIDYSEYNNLRNTVTHLIAMEDVVWLALKYSFIKNIHSATFYVRRYYNNYDLNTNEQLILEELKEFKRNSTDVQQKPLSLVNLKIIAYDEPKEYDIPPNLRIQNSLPPTMLLCMDSKRYKRYSYSVSNLVIHNFFKHKKCTKLVGVISILVKCRDTLEASYHKDYTVYLEASLSICLDMLRDMKSTFVLKDEHDELLDIE
ncbi:hypothetical protein ENBRE01_0881 [Enteropsectra breve]|nr:hypothetical protein ENBRE01_0881 [Enteropsectra breve]